MSLSLVLFVVQRSNQVKIKEWTWTPGELMVEKDAPKVVPANQITLLVPYVSLFFATAPLIEEQLPLVTEDSRHAVVILHLLQNEDLGSTLLQVLDRYASDLGTRESKLMLASVSPEAKAQLDRTGMMSSIGRENVFTSTERIGEAVLEAWYAADRWIGGRAPYQDIHLPPEQPDYARSGDMQRVAAEILRAPIDEVEIDYFGLNHLGWVRRVVVQGLDHLPGFLRAFSRAGSFPGLPFTPELLESLRLIPNEYLYYYYSSRKAVANLRAARATRGQLLAEMNRSLHRALAACIRAEDDAGIRSAYFDYLHSRGSTYMASETGSQHPAAGLEPAWIDSLATEGYAGLPSTSSPRSPREPRAGRLSICRTPAQSKAWHRRTSTK